MDSSEKLFSKKHIIYLLVLLIMVVAIPLGVKLVQQQQVLKSRAAGGAVEFVTGAGSGVTCEGNSCTTTTKDVQVYIQAPADFTPAPGSAGAGGGTSPTASPTNSPAPTGGSGGGFRETCPASSQRLGLTKSTGPFYYAQTYNADITKCTKYDTNCDIPQGYVPCGDLNNNSD